MYCLFTPTTDIFLQGSHDPLRITETDMNQDDIVRITSRRTDFLREHQHLIKNTDLL